MEHKDILHQIVETEKRAKAILAEANQRREQLSRYIDEKGAKLREDYEARAGEEVAAAEREAVLTADGRIAKLDSAAASDLNRIKSAFDENHEAWAEALFNTVIGRGTV